MPISVSSLDVDIQAVANLIGGITAMLVAITTLVTVLKNNRHLRDIKNETIKQP